MLRLFFFNSGKNLFQRVWKVRKKHYLCKLKECIIMGKRKIIGWLVTVVLTLTCWFVPTESFGVEGLTVIHQRVIVFFVLSACMWITEVIPIWATSVVLMVGLLLTVSDSMLAFMGGAEVGIPIAYKSIMSEFANPTVMLFMGGFVLAIGATKYRLDANLARVVIGLFGKKPRMVMLGFIVVTAMLSMFMSNTATAAMMITILTPVLSTLPEDDVKGKTGLTLAIPVAANIGGIGTPIGTPPNVVAKEYVNSMMKIDINFGEWMLVMVPLMLVILAIAWLFIGTAFKSSHSEIEVRIDGEWDKSWKAVVVYVTFVVTVLLWLFGEQFLGVNCNVVALIPFAVFCIFGIVTKEDLGKINWDVLWLVAGGFALGAAISETGLDSLMVNQIPFGSWSPVVVLVSSGLLCLTLSTFMSNSATAAMMVPIIGIVAFAMKDMFEGFGGSQVVIIGVALSASLAMSLPISTPPNAIAYSKGFIKQKDMVITGLVVGVIGFVLGYLWLIAAGKMGLL